jgi:hypothetical protein
MQSVSTFSGRALWGSVCECLDEACRLTLQAILEHLEVEYFKSEKSVRFLRISRFWHYFQICNIPLLSAPNRHAKCFNIFRPGAVRICVWSPAKTGRVTLHASLEHLEVEFCKSEKSFRFLKISRFWHFFQICNIPLLSAPNQYAKCFNIFNNRELGGGGGLAAATICSQSPGKIHHISSFPIVRHLVRPPVATYGSCFLTCLVISFKKPYKGWINKKMPEAT